MSISGEMRRRVEDRAGRRCEYCRLHSALQGAVFHIDHVRPLSAGGPDDFDNLSYACPTCNLAKSNRDTLIDPDTGNAVPLFNPRRDPWSDHFRFEGYYLIGRTACGRAVVAAFDLNTSKYIFIRSAEEQFGLYPPDEHDVTGTQG
jgi:CRISPR/Cas system-associated protein Cas10 (large subunit of type III CRISPR-Cas system)